MQQAKAITVRKVGKESKQQQSICLKNWRTVETKKSRVQDPRELIGKLGEVTRPFRCLGPSRHKFILSSNPFRKKKKTVESKIMQLEYDTKKTGSKHSDSECMVLVAMLH